MSTLNSYFIDRRAAEAAVRMCLPMITESMNSKQAGDSGFLYLVVMDPLRTPHDCAFHDAILYEYAFGDRNKWDADYAKFARAKAQISWRTGQDGHIVQELRPHLLAAGDVLVWGSVVLDGIVVSASGANPWYDEAFAGAVAMCLRAIAKASIASSRRGPPFLSESNAASRM
jgi:hypothetical protein